MRLCASSLRTVDVFSSLPDETLGAAVSRNLYVGASGAETPQSVASNLCVVQRDPLKGWQLGEGVYCEVGEGCAVHA